MNKIPNDKNKKIYKDVNAVSAFFMIILAVVFIILQNFIQGNEYGVRYDLINDLVIASGILIGSIVSLAVFYFLVSRLRLNLVAIILIVLILFLIYFLASNYISQLNRRHELFTLEIDIWKVLPEYSQDFFRGIVTGFAMMAIVYMFFTTINSINPILYFFIYFMLGTVYSYEMQNKNIYFVLWGMLIMLSIPFSFLYLSRRYQIQKHEIKKISRIWNLLLIIIILISAFLIGNYMYNKYEELMKDCENKQEQQRKEKEKEELEKIYDNKSDIEYAERNNIPEPRIVGYYKSEEPLYLKTNIFNLNVDSYELIVKDSYQTYSMFNSYEDYYLQDQEGKEVKIIYSTKLGEALPTAEKVLRFEKPYRFSYNDLLRSADNDTLVFAEYEYLLFDFEEYKDILIEYGDYYSYYYSDDYFYDTVNFVSSNSDRYQEIKELALEITEGAETDYEKAKAIEKYFNDNYYYTLTPGIEDQRNPIDDFILEKKEGYCSYFATSMVVMMHMLDVEARVVGGYYSTLYSEDIDAYVMTTSDLHAWVEVNLENYGWVTFEPTTSRCAEGVDCHTQELPRNFSNLDSETIDSILQSVNTGFSFEDQFESENAKGFDTEEEGESIIDIKEKEEEERRREEDKKKQEEEKAKKEEEEKEKEKKEEEARKSLKQIVIIFVIVLVITVVLCILYYIYKRHSRKEIYKDLANKRYARHVDKEIRKIYISKLKLKDDVLEYSPRELLMFLENREKIPENIVKCYRIINRVLYSRSYTEDDMLILKKEYKSISRRK